MRLFFTLLILLAFNLSIIASAATPINIGETLIIHSKIIGEDRPIWIYVPENIKKDERLYVIYLLDGSDHFHTVTGIVKSLVDNEQIPKTMVVGIETTNRPRDFLPAINGTPKTEFQQFILSKFPKSGQENFLKFIDKELIPFIYKKYPTYPHRTLIGHSNGGTLALSAMFNKPQMFNNYLAISPNGWWSHDQTIANVQSLASKTRPQAKLFISIAGEGGRFYSGALDLLANMEENKPANLQWQFKQYPKRTHMSGILPAVSDGLEYLFSELHFKITSEFAKYAKVSALKNYYTELSDKYGFVIPVPIDIYVELAEQQQKYNRIDESLITLAQLVAEHKKTPYAHMRLAQGYMAAKNIKKAYLSFQQALDLARQQKREFYIIDALQDMVNNAKAKM